MYNSTFLCTYPFYDSNLMELNPISRNYKADKGDDYVAEEEDECIQDYLYKNELLTAFEMDEFNDAILSEKIDALQATVLSKLENSNYKNEFKDLVKEDNAFLKFFSYHSFHIMHFALCELFQRGDFTQETMDLLGKSVNDDGQ